MSGYQGGQSMQNVQGQMPENLQYDPYARQGMDMYGGARGNMYGQMGGRHVGMGRGMGYGAWPGQGYGGYPGRFQGGFQPGYNYGSNYGFGGGAFGMGGYGGSGRYGPGSYSPYGAGSMGYGGGSGMMGGYGASPFGMWQQPSPFMGFNPNMWAQQQMGYGGGYGMVPPGTGGIKSAPGMGGYQPYDPMNLVRSDAEKAAAKAEQALADLRRKQQQTKRWQDDSRCCFIAGTQVRMADGSDKPIEDIEIGEKVLGQDGAENVVLEFDRPRLGIRKLYAFNGGKPFVTSEHPFATSGGWKSIDPVMTAYENEELKCKTLRQGDFVVQLDTRVLLEMESITEHEGDAETPLYNFKLSGNNTYYANGLLTHNKGGDNGGGPGGNGNGGGNGSGGCFAKGTEFLMADGNYKAIEDIDIGDMTEFGEVTDVIRGKSDRQWFDYLGTTVTDEHFVLEDGTWKYVKDADQAILTDPHDTYYTLNTEQHLLCGVNGVIFTDDAVFDIDHKLIWDDMLDELNGKRSRTA